jgi:hypothetical protein
VRSGVCLLLVGSVSSGCTLFTTARVGGGAASHKGDFTAVGSAELGVGSGVYVGALMGTAHVQLGQDFFTAGAGMEIERHNLSMVQRVERNWLVGWRARFLDLGFRSVAGTPTGYAGVGGSVLLEPWWALLGVGEDSQMFGALALNFLGGYALRPSTNAGGPFITFTLSIDWGFGFGEEQR